MLFFCTLSFWHLPEKVGGGGGGGGFSGQRAAVNNGMCFEVHNLTFLYSSFLYFQNVISEELIEFLL